MEKIIYRNADLNDLDQLIELRVLMQMEVNEMTSLQIKDDLEYQDRVRKYFETNIPTETYMSVVALDQKGLILGAAGVCFYQKPPSIIGGTGLVGYVTNVYTREAFRKMGIGVELMKKLNQLAQDKKADKLHLGATNEGLGIYKRVGFIEPRFVSLERKF